MKSVMRRLGAIAHLFNGQENVFPLIAS